MPSLVGSEMCIRDRNRGPDYPTYLRIGRVPRLRKVQYSRLGVSRGPDPPSDGTRESLGYAEDSHHGTYQLEQRARLPHFHASRSSIDLAEGLNQKGRSPFRHREIPTAEQPQRTQDRSPHESDGQRGAVPETTTDQKKGILDNCLLYTSPSPRD